MDAINPFAANHIRFVYSSLARGWSSHSIIAANPTMTNPVVTKPAAIAEATAIAVTMIPITFKTSIGCSLLPYPLIDSRQPDR